jgi:hypothetical protein
MMLAVASGPSAAKVEATIPATMSIAQAMQIERRMRISFR